MDCTSEGLLHDRLNHPHFSMIQDIVNSMNKVLKPNTRPKWCSACQLAKSHRLLMSNVHVRSFSSFDIVYVDL